MKKFSTILCAALAAQAAFAATDYTPAAPSDVVYQTHQISEYKNEAGDGYVKVAKDYGWVEFRVTNTYADGHSGTIPAASLSYRFFIQENGVESPFLLEYQPATEEHDAWYVKLKDKEPLEWIDDTFTDAYDITIGSKGENQDEATFHRVYLYGLQNRAIERFGVQSRYKRGAKYYESETTWVTPTIPIEAVAVEEVKAVAGSDVYFDLQGRKVANPEQGIFVRQTQMTDGSYKTEKVVK